MPYRTLRFEENHFYHIYNRGNNKERIFFERENYRFFFQKIDKCLPPEKVEIHAFCLMPNHYHFLIRLAQEFDYSKAMNRLGISYARSVNSWYARAGHLFQGRFQAKAVKSMDYLLHLSRYIHLNPVFAKIVSHAEDWKYSSYQAYLQKENPEMRLMSQSEILRFLPRVRTESVLSQFNSQHRYRTFVEDIRLRETQPSRIPESARVVPSRFRDSTRMEQKKSRRVAGSSLKR